MSDRLEVNAPRRRRRSWYRRRLRIRRALAGTAFLALIAFACWQNAARFFPFPAVHGSRVLPDSFSTRATFRQDVAWIPTHASKWPRHVERVPGVYPYSLVPGGLKDGESLRRVARNDRAVSRHFAHFDYDNAHLVRVTEPREVYVSYRIRDTVFWTRKKIRLHVGELLLTDGKITARAKCGNQVSDTAKPEVSNQEPEEDILDQPVALEPLGPSSPVRPVLAPSDLPTGQPIGPALYANGFVFPFVPPGGVPEHLCKLKNGEIDKKCYHHKPPPSPEPSTMILIASGFAVVGWRFRASKGTLPA